MDDNFGEWLESMGVVSGPAWLAGGECGYWVESMGMVTMYRCGWWVLL